MASTSEEPTNEKGFLKGAAKALLASVEEIGNNDDDDDDNNGDVAESIDARCRPLLRLFNPTRPSEFVCGENHRTAKKQETLFLDLLRSPNNKALLKRFFSGLQSIVEVILSEEAYVPESAFLEDGEDDEERDGTTRREEDRKAADCLNFLKYAALCAEAALEGRVSQRKETTKAGMQLQMTPQVYEVALQLHTILLSVHDCGTEGLGTRNAILSLCESWWLANAASRDSLIAQVLPLLVLQASDTTEFQKSHIKKLLTFKDAFQVIDFLNPSSDSLRSLLLKVASNPLCLKLSDGRRFLTSLFRDPDLVPDLHLSFRAQIPNASKTILQAYGEIYFKAWCEAEDSSDTETQEVIEHQVLQDLMHAAIHIASPAMAKSLLTVLEPVHSDKKAKRVADLLRRLYGPILWRSLSAANPLVRKNAVCVLEKVFPLHDPNQSQMKASMEKCFLALKSALQDTDPKVRIAASEATANICALFWEALPSAEIRMLLNHIVIEHASDVASAAVRAQALMTTTTLLEVPQSHAVLRPLLPSLGNLVHDKAEKVRLAAVKLLLQIKQTPGIHFYHVVPVDHLSARFSEEEKAHRNPKNSVNKELTALMLSSYFPQGRTVSAGDQIQRTMTFLMSDPAAAASFYANLADFLDVESIAKFIVMLLACLKSAVQTEQANQAKNSDKGKKRRRYGTNTPTTENEEESLSSSNTTLMVGLAETISTLLESISQSLTLAENKPAKKLLVERLQEADIANILSHFEQRALDVQSSGISEKREDNFRICRALLASASCMPQDSLEGVYEFVVDSLEAIASDASVPIVHVSAHLSLLANWGMIEDIATALAVSLATASDGAMDICLLSPLSTSIAKGRSRKSKGKGQKGKHKRNLPEFSAKLACSMIDYILSASSASSLVLREHLFASAKSSETIEEALSKAMNFAERLLDNQSAMGQSFDEVDIDLILCCCETYGRFALHRGRSAGNGSCASQIRMVLDWTTEHVLPVLVSSPTSGSNLQDLDLSRISNASDSLVLHESPGLMSPPKQRINLGRRKSDRLSSTLPHGGSISSSYHSLADVLARVLMQSSCLVVSEFLLVGGPYAEEVGSNVSRWCSIFDTRDNDDERSRHMKTKLLPSFVRLAVQLAKSSNIFVSFKELVLKSEKSALDESEDIFKHAVKSLLHNNKAGLMENLTDTLLTVCSELLQHSEATKVMDVATSLEEVWAGGSVGAVLEMLSKNPKSCKLLAEKTLSNLLAHRGDVTNETIFYAKCLSFLMPLLKSDVFAERITNEMNVERPEFEEVRSMMEKVVHVNVSA